PGAATLGEPVVIVCFAVMHVHANAPALLERVIKVPGHFRSGVILEELRIGPLHATVGEQAFRGCPGSTQSFEQKNGFGKFLANARRDVTPGVHWHFITRVTTKTVHTAPAPNQES